MQINWAHRPLLLPVRPFWGLFLVLLYILYHFCRDCQEADWKQGRNGRTHKQICGKPLQGLLGTDGADTGNDSMDQGSPLFDVPPLAPGFRRSAALLHQINFLVKPTLDNYVVRYSYIPIIAYSFQ